MTGCCGKSKEKKLCGDCPFAGNEESRLEYKFYNSETFPEFIDSLTEDEKTELEDIINE